MLKKTTLTLTSKIDRRKKFLQPKEEERICIKRQYCNGWIVKGSVRGGGQLVGHPPWLRSVPVQDDLCPVLNPLTTPQIEYAKGYNQTMLATIPP
jgi:hypothetical protein